MGPVSETSLRNGKDDKAIRELQRLYAEAKTESARRSLALRAMDEGLIRRGGPVFNVDQILGTHYESDLRPGNAIVFDRILLADQPGEWPSPDPDRVYARGYFGTYLDLEYDTKGVVQYYRFSNLQKGHTQRADGQFGDIAESPPPVEELKQALVAATSQRDRREICFRAIEGGVITTSASVDTVDAIFGTHLAADLPNRRTRHAFVNLSGPYPAAGGAIEKMTTRDGAWFMDVEYLPDGRLSSYYVTNVRK